MLDVKKRSFILVLGVLILSLPAASAVIVGNIEGLYYDFQYAVDFLIIFALLSVAVVPITAKHFSNEENKHLGLMIGFILSFVFSSSLIIAEIRYNFSLLNVWPLGILFLVAALYGGIKKISFDKLFGENSKWYTIPLALLAGLMLMLLILPDLTSFFPFYYLKDRLWAVMGILIGSLAILAVTKFKFQADTTPPESTGTENDATGDAPTTRPTQREQKLSSVKILVPRKGDKLTKGQSTKLDVVVPGFNHDDENLEYFWTADFPLNNPTGSSIIIPWDAVAPQVKPLTKKINVTVGHKITRARKSDTVSITFLVDLKKPEDELNAKVEIQKPKSRNVYKVAHDEIINFKCRLVAYNPSMYNKNNIKFRWYLVNGHVPVLLENVGSLTAHRFGQEARSFRDKLAVPSLGPYTLAVVAVHSNQAIAVDSQYLSVIKGKIDEFYSFRHRNKDLRVRLTDDRKTNKKIIKAIKKLRADGSLDAMLIKDPNLEVINIKV